MESQPKAATQTIRVMGDLSRAEAEALQLEVKRLARRHGVHIVRVRVERIPEG
jgi:hypothetical protein